MQFFTTDFLLLLFIGFAGSLLFRYGMIDRGRFRGLIQLAGNLLSFVMVIVILVVVGWFQAIIYSAILIILFPHLSRFTIRPVRNFLYGRYTAKEKAVAKATGIWLDDYDDMKITTIQRKMQSIETPGIEFTDQEKRFLDESKNQAK